MCFMCLICICVFFLINLFYHRQSMVVYSHYSFNSRGNILRNTAQFNDTLDVVFANWCKLYVVVLVGHPYESELGAPHYRADHLRAAREAAHSNPVTHRTAQWICEERHHTSYDSEHGAAIAINQRRKWCFGVWFGLKSGRTDDWLKEVSHFLCITNRI